ncbi:MAG: hypothetical protein GWN17_07430 [Candidatus Korarchaeota archaeon]|nr:hypothetical protein [Candidatus Korarchaeota archaeon]
MLSFEKWSIQTDKDTLTIDGDRVSWVKADRTVIRYICRQLGVSDDFHHSFTVCILEGGVEDDLNRGFIRFWEIRNDWGNRAWIYARKNGDGWTIHFEQLSDQNEVIVFHGSSQLHFKNRYFVQISHSMGVYRLSVKDHKGVMVEDSGELKGVSPKYSCIWLASTIKSRRNNGNWSSGYIEGLTIKNTR